ncbi:MAG TPA: glycoside hydrolase family 36 protein [Armatimonadota bacterium]
MKLIPVLLATLGLASTGHAVEPFRLAVKPGSLKWTLQERTARGWRTLLADAEVRANRPDGSPITFSRIAVATDGRAIILDSAEMRLKIVARWLAPSKLAGTAVILPEAYARHPGVALGSISLMASATLAPLGNAPTILQNGYQSSSRTGVTPLEPGMTVESWWVTALRGTPSSCVFGYLSSVNGLNSFSVERTERSIMLTDKSDLRRVTISTSATGTSLDALYIAWGESPSALLNQYAAAARGYIAALDGVAVSKKAIPAGWSTLYRSPAGITEDQVLTNADAARARFGAKDLRVIQVEDGYQVSAGDWDANARFPHGHHWLTTQLRAKGFKAGISLAPFAVSESSDVFREHADWLLKRSDGSLAKMGDTGSWGGATYSLDPALPAVRTWLVELFRKVTREWGYDFVKIDLLSYPLERDAVAAGSMPPVAAYRAALRAIRSGCGAKTYILGSGAPIGPSMGLVDALRIGPDGGGAWPDVLDTARNAAARQWMNGIRWQNDRGVVSLGEPLTPGQARASAALAALSGCPVMLNGDPGRLDDDRASLASAILPVTATNARIADLWAGAKEPASVWVLPKSISPAGITVAGLFNWTDAAKPITLNPLSLGVAAKAGRVHVWDVFNRAYLGDHKVVVEIPPTACRLLALTPNVGHPQIIGTDSHLTSGAKDIIGGTWVPKYRALKIQIRSTPGRAFHIAVSEPVGIVYRVVEATGATVARLPSEPGSVLLQVTPQKTAVRMVLRFQKG